MAEKVSRTAFANKFKKKTGGGWKKAAGAEAKARGARLPAGLIDAVGQLVNWVGKFDAKGNPQFNLECVVIEPEEHTGKKFTVVHRMAESKRPDGTISKTVDDKLADLSSDVQLLGGETDGKDEDGLMTELDELVQIKPYFLFNTASFSDPQQVFTFIQGTPGEDYQPPEGVGEAVCPPCCPPCCTDPCPEPEADGGDAGTPTETAEAAGDDWVPQVEEVYGFKPPRSKAAVDLTVAAVDEKAKTVDLKNDAGKVVHKSVAWDKLIGDE